QKDRIKPELGKKITLMHKPESYLMVGVADGYDLYFAGKKLENGAYVSISLFGKVNPADSEKMTAAVCEILRGELGTDGASVYVTYHGVENWGFDGANF
ncbi:MAG: hypothetical protein K2N30_03945, partial [Clostridia bacterium]|nr:hypothetical protein [Clostridia bacterium]